MFDIAFICSLLLRRYCCLPGEMFDAADSWQLHCMPNLVQIRDVCVLKQHAEQGFCAMQSNQLRQLVQDSLNNYVAFFEQYRDAGKAVSQVHSFMLPA